MKMGITFILYFNIHLITFEYYMYDDEDLNSVIELRDVNTRDYEIVSGMFRITQSMDNFLEK